MYRDWILCTVKIREGIDEWVMNRFTNLIECTLIRYMIGRLLSRENGTNRQVSGVKEGFKKFL